MSPSRAQRGLPYRGFDLEAGVDHLRQLGVPYYAAFSERAVDEARAHRHLTELATSGPWTVFAVDGADLVVPLDVEPAAFSDVDHAGWMDPAVEVFQQGSEAVVRTVGGPDGWQRVAAADQPERRPLPAVVVRDVQAGVDTVSFRVDRLGVPVLVRTSYFPNWEVEGALGPWRATPNLMVVVPTDEEVRLSYGRTTVDVVAMLLTAVGLVALLVLVRRPEPDDPSAPWYDAAALGPDGDRRVDRWVERRTAGSPDPDGDTGDDPADDATVDGDEDTNVAAGGDPGDAVDWSGTLA